ncbi:MAG: ABC transporter ATP-binding protein/permease, partial [Gemmatimonadota bacterium]|nr:ABC transporter ATP-binding protein/permease [Gemmatimonadota bacterium]
MKIRGRAALLTWGGLPAATLISGLSTLLDGHQRLRAAVLLLGMVLGAALEMIGVGAIPAFVALLTDPSRLVGMITDTGWVAFLLRADLPTLALWGASALAVIFLVKNVYLVALIYAEGRVLRDVATTIANRLYRGYLYSPYTFHLQRNPAELIRNIGNEVDETTDLLRNLAVGLRESLVLTVVFLLLLLVDPGVTLAVFMLVGTAAAGFYMAVRHTLLERGKLAQAHRGRRMQAMNEGLGSIKDAKLLGRESYLVDAFSSETRAIEHHQFYPRVIAALPRLFLEVVAIVGLLLVVVGFVVLGRGTQSMLPILALLAVAMTRLIPAFNAITSSLTNIRYDWPAFELVSNELETLEGSGGGLTREHSEATPFKLKTAISVDDLHFRYPESSVDALNGISLKIVAGEVAAFVGPSGAGKSTLVDVILGLLTPTSGQVRVDGEDIQHLLTSWQRQIGYVPQDIYLTDDTIRRNVALGLPVAEIDEPALTRALHTARLDSFIANLPQGLDTVVGNRGVRLSGGQRQRIGIARAVYHDPSVVVLDEATSALDNEAEREIIEAVGSLRGSRTVIMIAHRLTTVRSCDRLYLVRAG